MNHRIALLLAVATAGCASAPAPGTASATTGMFVTTLGTDTIAVERYTRTPGRLEGDVLSRFQGGRNVHYVAELNPDGGMRSIAFAQNPLGPAQGPQPAVLTSYLLEAGSAIVSVQRGGRPDTLASRRKPYSGTAFARFPGLPSSAALYEQMLLAAKPATGDSAMVSLIAPGAQPPASLWIAQRSPGTYNYRSSFFPNWGEAVTVDARGLVTSIDATGTTVGTMTRRASGLDFDALRQSWTAMVASGAIRPQASPPDTVRVTAAGANIEIAYSRPLRRGRTIFGTVVPWDQVWRTGANAATHLTTSRDLVFGNTVVPAGKYTLFTLPSRTGTKLIINTQTGQWGTDYDPKRDLARIDLTARTLTAPVDQFTIAVDPGASGGTLRLAWDRTEYSAPFTVR